MLKAENNKETYRRFTSTIIQWYKENKRDLPWRKTKDPYKIWLSEIILQQTQVKQGLPYYEKFIETYPKVEDLAHAGEEEVLRLWQGLGYYSRARNLHFSARMITYELGGFPDSYNRILKLKGVGKYTAAAVASFAFDEKQAVLDGNVTRVLCRFFGIEEDVALPKTQTQLLDFANSILPNTETDVYNQGIMEFGALQCVPKNPNCMECPVREECIAYNSNKVSTLPIKSSKLIKKNRYFYYLVIKNQENKIAMQKRGPKDIWQGLFEFPLIETKKKLDLNKILETIKKQFGEIVLKRSTENQKHVLTHQNINYVMLEIELNKDTPNYEYYTTQQIDNLPKPILIEKFLQKNIF